jgi:uncharacterized protein
LAAPEVVAAKDVGYQCADGDHGSIGMATAPITSKADCAIAVMAKSPRSGAVKTRLVPPLTPQAASALSASFLRDTTENIARAARRVMAGWAIHGYVAYAPAGIERDFDGMLAGGTRLVLADGSGVSAPDVHGLGRSLLHAARSLFAAGHAAVCLLNSDTPNLPTALLARAACVLAEGGDRVVLGPAEDGGYYLLGMKAAHRRLFADITWSSSFVAEETIRHVAALGLEIVQLDSWYDVDDASSLSRLCRDLVSPRPVGGLEPYPAPATADCVARLRLRDALIREAGE